ncbi:MAG TPA: AMP-binding protein, partial [Tepidiformaceae bacterium]
AIAGGLVACGVEPGQSVALMLPTSAEYFSTFLGVLRAGAIPVPIYPPVRRSQIAEHLRRQCGILANAGAVALVTVPEARPLARLLRSHVDSMRTLTTADELSRSAEATTLPVPAPVRPDTIALLQYTSGSTGDPKGVMLTHRQLLANISAMGRAAQAGPADVFVSWLPLYHDMGLIGAWLSSLYLGFALVVMSPMDFLARPARWLHAIQEHRATLTAGPNFAFELCLRRIRDEEISGVDLSGMRMMFNGAEPVSPATVEHFVERFAGYGLRPNALAPVYGLAEAAVGLAFPPPGRAPVVDAVNRRQFQRHGLAVPPKDGDPSALRFVACGRPLPGYQLRVVDPSGHELPNRNEGRIEFTGPSATTGYFRNPEATAQLRSGSWLHTGDLGYIAGGDIFVTGRIKDVIIRAGRNLHPIELEEAIGTLPGVRTGCVAVFASPDPKAGTEKLVVLAETREHDSQELERLRRSIIAVTIDLLGTPPDEVALAPPGAVLKTSSGKIRRAATRVRFEKGLTRSSGPSWWHLARFAWTGTLPSLRRRLRAARASVYAGYAWTVLVLIAVPAWLTIVMVPSRTLRWRTLRTAGRTLRHLLGIPVSVSGTEHIQECPHCLIVANHGSYLDGLALALALPHPVRFIVAADYERQPFVGVFLRRLGSEFVARRGPREGIADTMHIEKLVRSGESVVVFPEGTRSRAPGLRPFHLGAFTVAGETGVPVVPAGIYGARDVLRPG